MTIRLFFLAPDESSAQQVTEALRTQKVEDDDIHAVARHDKVLNTEGIPEASVLERSDIIGAAKRGATIGGTAGIFAGLTAVAITPLGLVAAGGAVLGSALAGATAGTWTSTMIGVSVPNTELRSFQEAIDEGQILMLVDVDETQSEAIKALVQLACPEAVVRSGELQEEVAKASA
tara:strand:- start:144 stop:671 length:528 start_codon:yes stop_codon:yes gene_type:complete